MRSARALPDPTPEGQKLALRDFGFPRAPASGLFDAQPANTNREIHAATTNARRGLVFGQERIRCASGDDEREELISSLAAEATEDGELDEP